jgi:mevalonate kinase
MKLQGVGQSHAKVILLGEHAVVYGHPGIALPFLPLTVQATIQQDEDFFLKSAFYEGFMQHLPDELLFLFAFAQQLAKELNSPPFRLQLDNMIPTSAGLGSSAAIADAITQAMFDWMEQPLSKAKRFEWTQISEKMVHGNPSGIDALMVQSDTPYWFAKGQQPKPIPMAIKGSFLIIDSGIPGKTKEAIGRVAKQYMQNTAQVHLESIGLMVPLMEEALLHEDEADVARLMNQAHYHLHELSLSHPIIDDIIEQCLSLGATGAKLTGGGLGGSILVYAPNQTIAQTIQNAMAPKAKGVWIMTL